jgi:NAD(P)-dependent dehydrogenase (short-subunit alcohol dehydrogenase family)
MGAELADRKLEKRVAVVTGSTSGIGKAVAELFAQEGAYVIVTGRREDHGSVVTAGIIARGGKAAYCQADLTIDEDVERLVASAAGAYGGIDILVNNAGLVPRNSDGSMADGPLHRTDPEYWERIWRLDVRSILMTSKLAIPHLMSSNHASIINIASIHGADGAGLDVYSAAKGAIISLTRSMAVSYGHRIRVNCISPGMVLVERTEDLWKSHPEMMEQYTRDSLTRVGRPIDVAQLCLFLASSEGEFATGVNYMLDGGASINGAFPPSPTSAIAAFHVGAEQGIGRKRPSRE